MSTQDAKHDHGMQPWRLGFWYALSGTLAIAVVVGIVFGTAFLTGCLFAFLRALLPCLRRFGSEWLMLISTSVSLLLMGVFIYMDNRKWHIGERLRRHREGGSQSKASD